MPSQQQKAFMHRIQSTWSSRLFEPSVFPPACTTTCFRLLEEGYQTRWEQANAMKASIIRWSR
eukprot:3064759-Prorocentrum_lima.AAC.1